MRRFLFVTNGHGEAAVASRLAEDVAALAGESVALDHFPLVGAGGGAGSALAAVGPRRALPSGGLVAMGNVRALASDVRAGFLGLFAQQAAFLRREGPRYDGTIAVGDVYGLALTLLAGRAPVFVGTAKSVYVAPYGRVERVLLRRAARVFVRDLATAADLLRRGVAAEAPGNVIVDLLEGGGDPPAGDWIALLPGSREPAYGDGVRLARLVRALGERRSGVAALLSIAPVLDPARFARDLADDGWELCAEAGGALHVRAGRSSIVAWRGPLGPLLRGSRLAIGQAGTANEEAAAAGVPIVALGGDGRHGSSGWYRMRQHRLLGEALLLVPAEPVAAAAEIDALLDDPGRLAVMSAAGRRRMGPPGGSRAIARAILDLAA
jgi:tetraacyldisaccharide 4'-kinase